MCEREREREREGKKERGEKLLCTIQDGILCLWGGFEKKRLDVYNEVVRSS